MKKWTCQCGYPMDDYSETTYDAYPYDVVTRLIATKTDFNGEIDVDDIPITDISLWQCTKCNSLMVIDRNQYPNHYRFYQSSQLDEKKWKISHHIYEATSAKKKIRIAAVVFSQWGSSRDKEYSYICDDPTIYEQHTVEVPVGKDNRETLATVRKIYEILPEESPYPVNKMKRVIKRYSHFDWETAEKIAQVLETHGNVLDLTGVERSVDEKKQYDLIQTPLGQLHGG
ncbi:MAG: hypothetical protein Q4A55_00730 [Aerococcus sp.]|nr:hypothetical protein [Aerococcus sp.]